jgi:anti-sigma B factor antagonist
MSGTEKLVYTPAPLEFSPCETLRLAERSPESPSGKEERNVALKMTTRDVGGVTVLELDGRIVFGEETHSLREKVKSLLAEGKKKLVLNMAKVSYVDSTGLGTLVGIRHSVQSANAALRLSSVESRWTELMQMTQLWPLFDVSPTEAEAVRALQ